MTDENIVTEEEPVFENYKQRQNYYKEKYKNRGRIFFAQPTSSAKMFTDNMVGTIKRTKGRTYKKDRILGDL